MEIGTKTKIHEWEYKKNKYRLIKDCTNTNKIIWTIEIKGFDALDNICWVKIDNLLIETNYSPSDIISKIHHMLLLEIDKLAKFDPQNRYTIDKEPVHITEK